jgi:sugar/nucleoside kinase (ribokinase family)
MKKLLCIGDIFLDILASPFPIEKEKILQDGETFVSYIKFQRGGCSGNFVAVLKSIFPQIEVEFVSRIGNDPNGDFLIQEMKKYGVTQKFIRDSSAPSAITIAISYKDGERHFITNLGAIDNFTIHDISNELFTDVNHLAYRGIWFMDQLLEHCTDFLKIPFEKNIPISMDLGFDPYWNKSEKDPEIQEKVKNRKKAALNALQYITYLFGNEKEFMHLTDQSTLDKALIKLLEKGVKNIIVHRGSKGAVVILSLKKGEKSHYKSIEIPAAKINVMNPVGSGDTFDSILVGQILEGKTIIQAAALAAAGAAYSLQSPPGTKITLEAVTQFIHQYPILEKLLH